MPVLFLIGFQVQLAAEDVTLRLTINVNAYDRAVKIIINDVHIKKITGGQARALQLYHQKHPMRKGAPKDYLDNFCLKEGKNTIRISHQKTDNNSPSSLEVIMEAIGYEIPVLKYTRKGDVKSGETTGTFELYSKQPEGFKTVILE